MSDLSIESNRAPRREFRYDPAKIRGEEVYGAARRHSGLVRWLKIILPTLAIAAIVGFVLAMRAITSDIADLFTLAGVAVDTKSLVMEKPHLSGFKGTEHAYEMHAERAVQDLASPKIVRLEEIAADFGLSDDVRVQLEATAGVFDGYKEILSLSDGITVASNNGFAATLEAATVDFEKGTLVSDTPVTIRASGLDLLFEDEKEEEKKSDDGAEQPKPTADAGPQVEPQEKPERRMRVKFTGGVSLTYIPPPPSQEAAASSPETQ